MRMEEACFCTLRATVKHSGENGMSTMSMSDLVPKKSSRIRTMQLMGEYLQLSLKQRNTEMIDMIEAQNAKASPVEQMFKAALVDLKS